MYTVRFKNCYNFYCVFVFFFNGTATTEIYTLSLHDALPISGFFIAKYFSLLVSNSHSGSICFTSAFTGLNPEAGKGAYGVSKAALIHLIKTLSEEGKEIHLSANAIAPFIIDTLANREWMKDADYDSWMKPEEIGELIHSIFNNYNFVSGNVFELKNRFNY